MGPRMKIDQPFSEREIEALRASGTILSQALQAVIKAVQPGVTAAALDAIADQAMRAHGGTPAFKGYRGFPASLCVSLNDEVVHGIPRAEVVVRAGDVVGLDGGVSYRGMFTDMATTVLVGRVSEQARRLVRVTRQALAAALRVTRASIRIGDIGAAVQAVVEAAGFAVVRDLVGHGVGRAIHAEPSIPNYGQRGTGAALSAGQCLAIEPMVTAGGYAVRTDADGWTVRTADGSLAAHEERTVLVTERGYELLTPL